MKDHGYIEENLNVIPYNTVNDLNMLFEKISKNIGEHPFKCGVKAFRHLLFAPSSGIEIKFYEYKAAPELHIKDGIIPRPKILKVPNVINEINKTINDRDLDPVSKKEKILIHINDKPSLTRRSGTTEFLDGIKKLLEREKQPVYGK